MSDRYLRMTYGTIYKPRDPLINDFSMVSCEFVNDLDDWFELKTLPNVYVMQDTGLTDGLRSLLVNVDKFQGKDMQPPLISFIKKTILKALTKEYINKL